MLFGHQDDSAKPAADDNTQTSTDSVTTPGAPTVQPAAAADANPLAVDPETGISLPATPEPLEHETEPAVGLSAPAVAADNAPAPLNPRPGDDAHQGPNGDLLQLKQQALEQLSPLVNHLDQTPEEKFRTTMMMIQSADNQSLIPQAYEAAQAIADDKARAQALLDIINEINYFTQHNAS